MDHYKVSINTPPPVEPTVVIEMSLSKARALMQGLNSMSDLHAWESWGAQLFNALDDSDGIDLS